MLRSRQLQRCLSPPSRENRPTGNMGCWEAAGITAPAHLLLLISCPHLPPQERTGLPKVLQVGSSGIFWTRVHVGLVSYSCQTDKVHHSVVCAIQLLLLCCTCGGEIPGSSRTGCRRGLLATDPEKGTGGFFKGDFTPSS